MKIDKFFLDRFAFAAQTIAAWTRYFGRDRSEALIKDALTREYSLETREAFRTAFGR